VLAVVLFHLDLPFIPGGFLGVDVFYVISGYLISGILCRELGRSDRIDLLRFYGRRMKRLLPASLLVTVVTLAVGSFVLSPLELEDAAKGAAASTGYVSNIWFYLQSLDYFSADAGSNPFLHTWSLAIEEQFYLFWPMLLWLAWTLGRGRQGRATLVIALVTLASLLVSIWLTPRSGPASFYLLPARAWEFGAGALAAMVAPALARLPRPLLSLGGWAGLAGLVASVLLFTSASPFPGWLALLPVSAALAVLIAGASMAGPARLLAARPLAYLGMLSYSLYLWHWPAIVLVRAYALKFGWPEQVVALALTWLLSELGFRLVEHPIRESAALGARKASLVVGGLAAAALGIAGSLGVAAMARDWQAAPAQRVVAQAARQQSTLLGTQDKCLVLIPEKRARTCTFGPADAPALVLIGDSHAAQWITPVERYARSRSMRLVTLLKVACPFNEHSIYYYRLGRTYTECDAWRADAFRTLAQLKPAAIIAVEHDQFYLSRDPHVMAGQVIDTRSWEQALLRTVRTLRAITPDVTVIADNPLLAMSVPTCLSRMRAHGRPDSRCDFALPSGEAAWATGISRRASLSAGARWIDPNGLLCRDGRCPAVRDGVPVYRDHNHISEAFMLRFGHEVFERGIAPLR